jgi:ATP-dependent DNA helicase RecG
MNDTHDITIPFWKQPESRRLELKEVFPKGDQLVRTVAAFANGAGGKIVFGVRNEPREILGIPDDELFSLEEKISNYIFDRCTPVIIPEIYIQAVDGKNLLVVEIFPGSQKPYYLKSKGKHKGTYVRIGSSNRPASQEMLESLERDKRKISFDVIPVYDLSPEDLDLKRFKEDYKSVSGHALNKEKLKNIGLLVSERDTFHPTHAAVLLSESPARKRLFPYAKVECARFKGTDTKVFLDQATIEGPVYAAVEPCLAFIKKNIALSSKIGEVYREDRWEYPLEAIREAITNAIIHRDYAILGSDIKVAIFDDMLEITSPGPLPDTLPLEELGTGRSEIRNRVLAPIFKDLKLIEAWGTGIQKMRNEVSKYPEIELVLHEVGHAFQVQFRKKEVSAKKGPSTGQVPDKYRTSTGQVLSFCRVPKKASEIQKYLGLKHRETFMNNYLKPLLTSGWIERTIPEKPKSRLQKYRTTSKGQALLEQQVKARNLSEEN